MLRCVKLLLNAYDAASRLGRFNAAVHGLHHASVGHTTFNRPRLSPRAIFLASRGNEVSYSLKRLAPHRDATSSSSSSRPVRRNTCPNNVPLSRHSFTRHHARSQPPQSLHEDIRLTSTKQTQQEHKSGNRLCFLAPQHYSTTAYTVHINPSLDDRQHT